MIDKPAARFQIPPMPKSLTERSKRRAKARDAERRDDPVIEALVMT